MAPVTFLLVDDLEENLLSLEGLLRRDELVLLKARSGEEALELLLTHDVALALVDVQMPGLDGFELAELMRGNERTRRIPIIFVTAGAIGDRRRFRGYEAGAVDFIQKPIEPDILRTKADIFFELYKQRQQIAVQRDALLSQATTLEMANRKKDEFLAMLAHELRNPLAPIRHGLDVLQLNPETDKASEIRDMMDRQLSHLVRLVDDLLDVSRVSQGKIELRRQPVELETMVLSALEASRPSIEASGHRLTVQMCSDPLWLAADPVRVSQVVGNLLNNAVKYTPEGGEILLSTVWRDGQAVIEITDSGMGIPPEKLVDIFGMFEQIDHHRGNAKGGMGIGLALVKELVSLHGGTVQAESTGTGGSTFTVRLPVISAPAATTPRTETPRLEEAPLRVLVVEDNMDVAYAMSLMLEELGHDSHCVHDGREAIREARLYQPDIVLMDIGLPEMDGYEVCRAFRQDGQLSRLPIIAQTGWGQRDDKAKARAAGFDNHLTKPVSLDDLRQTLRRTRNSAEDPIRVSAA